MFIISDRQALETLHLSWVVCGEFKWTYYASYSVALELLLNDSRIIIIFYLLSIAMIAQSKIHSTS